MGIKFNELSGVYIQDPIPDVIQIEAMFTDRVRFPAASNASLAVRLQQECKEK